MNPIRHLIAALLLLTGIFAAPTSARAAQSYDNCTAFIDTIPATISTQGTWCLRHDVTTAITSGNAITIATNNVTIDCNDFKVGGLQAGNSSTANGIYAYGHLNATVRHCNVRGFYNGINLEGSGGGHLVEDNRLDQSLSIGINVVGDNNLVQRNRVYDTGGYPGNAYSYGIIASADVVDNIVAGVFATAAQTFPYAIIVDGGGSEARGNRVRGIVVAGGGVANGIYASGAGVTVDGNRVSSAAPISGYAISGNGANTFCSNNTEVNFSVQYYSCEASLNNLTLP